MFSDKSWTMRIPLLAFLLTLSFNCLGQLYYNPTSGAKSNAMGGANVTNEGIDAIFNNPAGLAGIEKLSFIASSEMRFLQNDVVAFGAGVTIPTKGFGNFGLSVSNLGLAEYKEQKIGLSYARPLSDKLDLGAQIDLLNTSIENFGSKTLFTFELGVQADLGSKFKIGAHLFSPAKISLLEEDNDINTSLSIGAEYNPSKKISIILHIQKWLQNPMSAKLGVDYKLIDNVSIRFGFSTNPDTYGIGIAYGINDSFSIDGGYNIHPILGSTPSFSIKNDR